MKLFITATALLALSAATTSFASSDDSESTESTLTNIDAATTGFITDVYEDELGNCRSSENVESLRRGLPPLLHQYTECIKHFNMGECQVFNPIYAMFMAGISMEDLCTVTDRQLESLIEYVYGINVNQFTDSMNVRNIKQAQKEFMARIEFGLVRRENFQKVLTQLRMRNPLKEMKTRKFRNDIIEQAAKRNKKATLSEMMQKSRQKEVDEDL